VDQVGGGRRVGLQGNGRGTEQKEEDGQVHARPNRTFLPGWGWGA
jgi:hypothetical protein